MLNKKDTAIQHTIECEDHKHSIYFLDINITGNTTNKRVSNERNYKYTHQPFYQ